MNRTEGVGREEWSEPARSTRTTR